MVTFWMSIERIQGIQVPVYFSSTGDANETKIQRMKSIVEDSMLWYSQILFYFLPWPRPFSPIFRHI
jgi:hypothetical protein